MFIAGEAGAESVQVTNLTKPGGGANAPQQGLTINFSGNILSQDWIETDAIPQIKEAIRRGADIGIS